jgi:hypothetical protein
MAFWLYTSVLEKHIVSILSPKDGGSMFCQNIVDYMEQQLRRPQSILQFSHTPHGIWKQLVHNAKYS